MVLHKIYLPVKKKWYPKVPGIHPKWHKYNKPNSWNGLHTKFDQSKEACSHAVMGRAASWRLCSKQKEHGILKTVVLQRGQRDISKQGSLIHSGNSLKSSRWLSHRHFHGVSKNWNERLWTVPATPSPFLSLLAAATPAELHRDWNFLQDGWLPETEGLAGLMTTRTKEP